MLVVFVFVRRMTPTIAAGISVPLALAGTCAAMWVAGFSINNLSLMALAVSVGFVVDDAIVMIENMYRNLEDGMRPYQAALLGAKQIRFHRTLDQHFACGCVYAVDLHGRYCWPVVPRVLADADVRHHGVHGRVADRDADDLRALHQGGRFTRDATRFDRLVEGSLSGMVRFYERTLHVVLRMPIVTMLVFIATIALTVTLYIKTPEGIFPD